MSFTRYRERTRDVQDGIERHVWGEQQYLSDSGSIVKVKGTDTQDEEAPVLNNGSSFNLKKDHDSEVMLLASASDTNQKVAMLTIPRDKQRRWLEGAGGIQHPTDPEFALDFSDKLAHVTKNKFGVGEKGEFEVRGGKIYIRGDLIVEGEVVANKQVKTPKAVQGTDTIPKFEGSKQAEVSKQQAFEDDDGA